MAHAIHQPHARGDEPATASKIIEQLQISPTHVGMNRPRRVYSPVTLRISPTHVGMNRAYTTEDLMELRISPTHVGMNRAPPAAQTPDPESAPRTWG